MDTFQQIVKIIRTGKRFLIVPHVRVDGDALGASLALHRIIKLVNKNCSIYLPEEIPESFKFLIQPDDTILQKEEEIHSIDVLISLDSSTLERTYITEKIRSNANILINIDHHKTNESFADVNLVLPDYSATCEIILKLSKIGYLPLTPNIADSLLTGIFTDTGFFRNSNVTDNTFEAAAELIRFGANHETLISRILQNKTIEEMAFHSECFLKSEFSMQKQVGWITITKELMEKYKLTHFKQVWGTGVIGLLKNIGHVQASMYFIEVGPEETIVEYRSKNPIDVSSIAKHFGGGGHKLASGCTIHMDIQSTKNTILDYFFKNYELA